MKNDIALLKEIFTYGDATNTHLDILDYLNYLGVSKSEYSKWGRNASRPAVEAEAKYLCFFCSTPTQPTKKGQACPICGGRPA